jgi:threonine dehydrogenase-like Zn-dependent dehydrogenase
MMRAVILDAEGVRFTAERPRPRVPPGETLIRVRGAGICETDLQLIRGYMGFRGILGHEFVGIAETGPWSGRRVVGEINCGCGSCGDCRDGRRNHCARRSVLGILKRDGAFADLLNLPQENLHLVPEGVSDVEAAFTEPLAAAFRIPEQIALERGQSAVVLGDGRLGNLCAQVLRLSGCPVTVVGKHERKLALLSRLGITAVKLNDFPVERAADLVVDCTGSPSGFPLALQVVRPRGTVVLKTTVAGEQTLSLAPIVIDEVTVVGSRCGPFARALKSLARHEIDVLPLCDGIVPLESAVTALERARTEPVLKLLLAVDPEFGQP